MTAIQERSRQCSPSYFSHRELSSAEVMDDFVATAESQSQATLASCFETELGLVYGDKQGQHIDVFYPEKYSCETTVAVYFHGGYWNHGSTALYRFVASPQIKNGNICVIVGKVLSPKANITEIIEQCRAALVFIAQKFPDTKRLVLSGHSSGGQECAMMLAYRWDEAMERYLASKLKSVVLLCGVFEMLHLVGTYVGEPLQLTKNDAIANSPIELVATLRDNTARWGCMLHLMTSEHDAPTITDWNKAFREKLKENGVKFTWTQFSGEDHFTLMLNIFDANFQATKLML